MKTLTAIAILVPGAALAHPGHYAEAAGHNHWIALGALAIAGAITAAALIRKAKAKTEAEDAPEDEDEDAEEAKA